MQVLCIWCLHVLCKPAGWLWGGSRPEMRNCTPCVWLEFESMRTLMSDLGVQVSSA